MKQISLLDLKTKKCVKCGIVKPISEFSEHKKTKDKLQHWCKKCSSENSKKWAKNNPEKKNKNNKKWNKNNLKYYREYSKKWLSIPKNRLSRNTSRVIRKSLKGNKKGYHWENLVSYTLQDLITHLESLFKEGMNWGNMGKWHIDHIKPISSFNFNSYNDPEFKECWALKNLQPLWEFENKSKGAKF